MLDLPEDGQRREVRHSALDELHGGSRHARRGPEEALRLRGAENGSGDTGEGHDEERSNEEGLDHHHHHHHHEDQRCRTTSTSSRGSSITTATAPSLASSQSAPAQSPQVVVDVFSQWIADAFDAMTKVCDWL